VPDGFDRTLRIVRPRLPPFAQQLELHGLPIAGGAVDLRCVSTEGRTEASLLEARGDVKVEVEAG
jgi:hypothetical protein